MREEDIYDDLGEWLQEEQKLGWYKVTHQNHFIIYTEDKEMLEPDICLGITKGQKYELTDVVHVKTRDNLRGSTERFELAGKANYSIKGVRRVWIAVEESSFWTIEGGFHNEVGIITYKEQNGLAKNFQIKREAVTNSSPKFYKETQYLFNEKFGPEIRALRNLFICSMDRENWPICKKEKLWGVPKDTPAESIIQKARPGDIILFRLNKGKGKIGGRFGFVAIWMIISSPFPDPAGGPWKRQVSKENRDFRWQVKIHPMLVDEFEMPIDLHYQNGLDKETGITSKSYASGMLKISEVVYKIISKKMIDQNLTQLNKLD